jgi:hypothetical protein
MGRTMAHDGTLHFVYNVDGTPLALAMDFVHRLTSPETYPCKLCDVTYGRFLKKAEWRRFLSGLPLRSEFHLRNIFLRRFPRHAQTPLPAVFLQEPDGALTVLIPADALNAVADLQELQELVLKKLETVAGH